MPVPLPEDATAFDAAADHERGDGVHEVAPDIAYLRLAIVNVAFLGPAGAGDRGWVLVDAGLPGTKGMITRAAEARFGAGARPAAILLTHGHFDHVGVLVDLAEEWDVPVFAHALEHPYLDGTAAYPPPDPGVGGGLMSTLSPLFPRDPVRLGTRLRALGANGGMPVLPAWRWVFTPGHSVGHVSFWREADRAMISGDAFITTRQESAYAAMTQSPEMHGPPAYFTVDWEASRESVRRLAALEPELVVAGHGRAMRGAGMRAALHRLAKDFDRLARPEAGTYLDRPARAEDGTAYRPPG
ncbi:MBL fold metallo-hydrolase [Roseococcus sp. SYP-B2431]|uniref:MBL fold metallo-hydrolase n=1 Tax=Roseococcus sp. SYP-B2431 TaxID=2496640 RepID=UPI00103B4D75|nr:MBL fold metallo-hydrolase [Roseococcus sp. SYP-B2431]TCH98319.1 MBL fold metallo-hydrolase [Roseococcus sp. SYP-B2431]